jgi:hypothetical protein
MVAPGWLPGMAHLSDQEIDQIKGWFYLPELGFELRLPQVKSRNEPEELRADLVNIAVLFYLTNGKSGPGKRAPADEHGSGAGGRIGTWWLAWKTRLAAGNQIHAALEARRHRRAPATNTCGEQRRSTPSDLLREREGVRGEAQEVLFLTRNATVRSSMPEDGRSGQNQCRSTTARVSVKEGRNPNPRRRLLPTLLSPPSPSLEVAAGEVPRRW